MFTVIHCIFSTPFNTATETCNIFTCLWLVIFKANLTMLWHNSSAIRGQKQKKTWHQFVNFMCVIQVTIIIICFYSNIALWFPATITSLPLTNCGLPYASIPKTLFSPNGSPTSSFPYHPVKIQISHLFLKHQKMAPNNTKPMSAPNTITIIIVLWFEVGLLRHKGWTSETRQ